MFILEENIGKHQKNTTIFTKTSIYSVPEFPDYPFLDPHWIIRVDGSCEIGPNAVPVFSPYGYDKTENIKEFIPKMLEMLGSGARKAIFDKQFQELAMNEIQSSMSKSAMVERVRRFFTKNRCRQNYRKRNSRNSIISNWFLKMENLYQMLSLENDESSFHILNYNSPGATWSISHFQHIL